MGLLPLNLGAIVENLAGKPPTELRTADEIIAAFDALYPTYKIFGPELLYSLWLQRRLNIELLRRLLIDVWQFTDFPRGVARCELGARCSN